MPLHVASVHGTGVMVAVLLWGSGMLVARLRGHPNRPLEISVIRWLCQARWMPNGTVPVVLAATMNDRDGRFLPGLERCRNGLKEVFSGVAVHASTQSDPAVVDFLRDALDARVAQAPAAPDRAGLHRRRSLALAAPLGSYILYSDLDHILRWVEVDQDELVRILNLAPAADMTVVGRTPEAMAACPRRLRETEAIVNHIYELMTGRRWDLMFALRLLSAPLAATIVAECVEDGIANDVEWPMYAERAGYTLGYAEAGGLSYRITQDFDARSDELDGDPAQWINRLDLAHQHAPTMRRFLNSRS